MSDTLRAKTAPILALMLAVVAAVGLPSAGQTVAPKAKSEAPRAKAAKPDLNAASAQELESALPGVGEVIAKKIVAGRPYKTIDDLARAGVPARTIEVIRPLVTVNPAPAKAASGESKAKKDGKKATPGKKVNINTASKDELQTLPDIGPARAEAIIEARPFKTIEDIKKVKGIKDARFEELKALITVN